MKQTLEVSYRTAAADLESPIGLLLALYDTLARDLRLAAEAIRACDIELRCAQLNHAYLVLGQLESWIDADRDPKLSRSLSSFYAYLRAKMLEASIKQSTSVMEALVPLVLQVRSSWQQREAELHLSLMNIHDQAHLVYQASSTVRSDAKIALSQTA